MIKENLEELIEAWEMLAHNFKVYAESTYKDNHVMYQTFMSTSSAYTRCSDELRKVLENAL